MHASSASNPCPGPPTAPAATPLALDPDNEQDDADPADADHTATTAKKPEWSKVLYAGRKKLQPPSHMWGPFRLTYRYGKPGKPGKKPVAASWQMTCPLHAHKEKTKCTRTVIEVGATELERQLGLCRLKYWAVTGVHLASKEAHQKHLGKARDWPKSFNQNSRQPGALENGRRLWSPKGSCVRIC